MLLKDWMKSDPFCSATLSVCVRFMYWEESLISRPCFDIHMNCQIISGHCSLSFGHDMQYHPPKSKFMLVVVIFSVSVPDGQVIVIYI